MYHHLLPEEKLAILREQDSSRLWSSLDDQRVCAVCERIFSGRQIEFHLRSNGSYQLRCPTSDCPSTTSHWLPCVTPAGSRPVATGKGEFSFL